MLKYKRELLYDQEFQDALLNIVDIVALRWSTDKLDKVRSSDPEEFKYQEELMRQYASLSLLLLSNLKDSSSSENDGESDNQETPSLQIKSKDLSSIDRSKQNKLLIYN